MSAVIINYPGYIEFPGTAGNYATVPLATPVDPSAEWRVEFVRPANPIGGVIRDATDTPMYIRLNSTGIQAIIFASDATFVITPNVTWATLTAAGFPAIGNLVQCRGIWDAAADLLSWEWRAGDGPLDQNIAPWTAGSNIAGAGKMLNQVASWRLTDLGAAAPFLGRVHRWLASYDGVLHVDVNPATDITEPAATTFEATTGQTVTVVRTGSPATIVRNSRSSDSSGIFQWAS